MRAQLRAHPRQQHAQAERLGDIVVGAGIEAENGVGLARRARQHDDGDLDPLAAQEAADIAPVHVGQADIEQDQVETPGPRRLERGRAGRRFRGLERLVQAQLPDKRFAQAFVVLDDENAFGRLPAAHSRRLPRAFAVS